MPRETITAEAVTSFCILTWTTWNGIYSLITWAFMTGCTTFALHLFYFILVFTFTAWFPDNNGRDRRVHETHISDLTIYAVGSGLQRRNTVHAIGTTCGSYPRGFAEATRRTPLTGTLSRAGSILSILTILTLSV